MSPSKFTQSLGQCTSHSLLSLSALVSGYFVLSLLLCFPLSPSASLQTVSMESLVNFIRISFPAERFISIRVSTTAHRHSCYQFLLLLLHTAMCDHLIHADRARREQEQKEEEEEEAHTNGHGREGKSRVKAKQRVIQCTKAQGERVALWGTSMNLVIKWRVTKKLFSHIKAC